MPKYDPTIQVLKFIFVIGLVAFIFQRRTRRKTVVVDPDDKEVERLPNYMFTREEKWRGTKNRITQKYY